MRDAAELFETSSAGLRPLGVVQTLTLETIAGNGYSVDGLYSKAIGNHAWAEADLVINMSGFPRQRAFPRGEWDKVEDWQVDDPYGTERSEYQRVFEDIRAKIESLKARLSVTKKRKEVE